MLVRSVKRLFTLRSRLDWVPRIFKDPKYTAPANINRKPKKETPEYLEFKEQQRKIMKKLNEKDTLLKFELRLSEINKMGLYDFSTRETLYLLRTYWDDRSKEEALKRMVKNIILHRGFELNIFQLNRIVKFTFLRKERMDVGVFSVLAGLLGSFLGPDPKQKSYIRDSFVPSYFESHANQKVFANLVHLLVENFKSQEPIHSVPQTKSVLDRFFYKYLQILVHHVGHTPEELHLPSNLHLLKMSSDLLPVGFFPDPKIIPNSHKYVRPEEVLQDKAWSEQVKSFLELLEKQVTHFKLRDLGVYLDVKSRLGALDDKTLENACKYVKNTLDMLDAKEKDPTYIINRLTCIHAASKGRHEKLNQLIKSAFEKNLASHIASCSSHLDSMTDSINSSWVEPLRASDSPFVLNHKLVSDINQLPKVLNTANELKIKSPELTRLVKHVYSSFSGLLHAHLLPHVIYSLTWLDCQPEVNARLLELTKQWVSAETSSFGFLKKDQVALLRNHVEHLVSKDKELGFDELVFTLNDKLNESLMLTW